MSDNISIDYIKLPTDPRFGYSRNATYGTNVYDSNPYVSDGLVLGGANIGIVSTNQTGITNGTQNLTVGTDGVVSSGSGTGAQFTITIAGTTITSINITSVGSGFSAGDTITIPTSFSWMSSDEVVLTLRNEDVYSTSTKGSTNFELHPSEEAALILSILSMTGLIIKDQIITKLGADYLVAQQRIKQQ